MVQPQALALEQGARLDLDRAAAELDPLDRQAGKFHADGHQADPFEPAPQQLQGGAMQLQLQLVNGLALLLDPDLQARGQQLQQGARSRRDGCSRGSGCHG